jgi:CelD/BcsL family acetyltransferase involved in cellulose biosynthesis
MSSAVPALTEFVSAEIASQTQVAFKHDLVGKAANSAISIERASQARLGEIDADWIDLLTRAHESNVFMDPAILRCLDAGCITLLAWQGQRLMGLWAFARSRLGPFGALHSPAFAHAYLATPVVDRVCADAALSAMLDYIAQAGDLPRLIWLDPIRLDGPTMQALSALLKTRGTAPRVLTETPRPILASGLDSKQYFEGALSSSSRKKLRQHRRRLEEKGALEAIVFAEPAGVRRAFEDFLALEAAGWKGQSRTALLCDESDANFARAMVAALAERGRASIHALYQGGKVVAAQIVLRAGPAAFTWKTAYDEVLGDYSPGMLLLENYTSALLADKSLATVDSCAFDDTGFMSVWRERELIGQVLIDARRGRSSVFAAVAGLQRAFLKLRMTAKAVWFGRRKWMRK